MIQKLPEIANKTVKEGNIEYLLNEEDKTASIFHVDEEWNDLIIPRSVKYESEEYLITSILKLSFREFYGKYLKFAPDTKIRTIESRAFYKSLIKSIEIPSSLIDLKEGWCCHTGFLKEILLSPENPRYKLIGQKFLLGKSKNLDQENYDTLVFVSRDTEKICIPSSIEIIDSYAFNGCSSLQNVDFAENSQLKIIGKKAFKKSAISKISIPSNVTQICEGSFSHCQNLLNIIFQNDTKLQKIGKKAFNSTKIECLIIPPSCTELHEKCFTGASNLEAIKFMPENDRYFSLDDKMVIDKSNEKLVFCCLKEKLIKIPNFVKIIGKRAFSSIDKPFSVSFPSDSKIQMIDDRAFSESAIEKISIPSEVTRIGKKAFLSCKKLKTVEFSKDSKLQMIEEETFSDTPIEKISIPSEVTQICYGSFRICLYLQEVEIPKDSKLKLIGKLSFYLTRIERFILPSETTQICERSFFECQFLKEFEIPQNSQLQIIEKEAFANTEIESLFIPTNCSELKREWNSELKEIKKISVSKENKFYSSINDDKVLLDKSNNAILLCARNISNLEIPTNIEIIGPYSFNYCDQIQSISIPSNVTLIDEYAFSFCKKLTDFIFEPNSKLQKINYKAFYHSSINYISIPSSVTYIGPESFTRCDLLKKIEIEKNSQLKIIDRL